jgi:hypothetical protein
MYACSHAEVVEMRGTRAILRSGRFMQSYIVYVYARVLGVSRVTPVCAYLDPVYSFTILLQ